MLKSKETWRWHMNQKRLVLPKEALLQSEKYLCSLLQQHANWPKWQRIGAHYPHGNECSLLATCHLAITQGKAMYLPCVGEEHALSWRRYDLHQPLTPNQWGISDVST